MSLGSSSLVRSAALQVRRRDRAAVDDWSGRLLPPYEPSPNPVVAEPVLFESMNASVEMIPAMVMEDVHVGRGDAPEAF